MGAGGGGRALGGGGAFFGAPFLSSPAAAAATTYQAESAKIYRAALETTHSGFSGSGYVNTYQEAGAYLEWLVTVPQALTATLIIRFANGSTANRPMAVRVNGAVVNPALSFVPTGGWPVWATRSLTAKLHAGTNTIRLTATTANGGPNIDLLDVNDETDWGRAMVESTIARYPDAGLTKIVVSEVMVIGAGNPGASKVSVSVPYETVVSIRSAWLRAAAW